MPTRRVPLLLLGEPLKQCKRGLMHCGGCGAHLCAHCYKLWHTEPDLVGRKAEIGRYLKKQRKADKKRAQAKQQSSNKKAKK